MDKKTKKQVEQAKKLNRRLIRIELKNRGIKSVTIAEKLNCSKTAVTLALNKNKHFVLLLRIYNSFLKGKIDKELAEEIEGKIEPIKPLYT